MHYFIPIGSLFFAVICFKGNGASPLASGLVREICEHMTARERKVAALTGALFGLGIALVLCGVGFVLGVFVFESALIGMMFSPLIAPVIVLLLWKRISKWQRDFLASTAWAKSEGIEADGIDLFCWQK